MCRDDDDFRYYVAYRRGRFLDGPVDYLYDGVLGTLARVFCLFLALFLGVVVLLPMILHVFLAVARGG